MKRFISILLLLAMLLSCLPLSVLAADAEPVEAENTVDAAPAEDAEVEDAAASRMAKTVPRNRIPAKNEKKSETAWFRSFSVCQ